MKYDKTLNNIAWVILLILTFLLAYTAGYIKGAVDMQGLYQEIVEDYKEKVDEAQTSKVYGYDLICENAKTVEEYKSCIYLEKQLNNGS